MIDVKLSIPKPIYDIYANAAKQLIGYSVEDVLSASLEAYAQLLFDEMRSNGDLDKK